jgi:hypothetical protein
VDRCRALSKTGTTTHNKYEFARRDPLPSWHMLSLPPPHLVDAQPCCTTQDEESKELEERAAASAEANGGGEGVVHHGEQGARLAT